MNYLVGENIFTFNSGTEISQIQRYKALKQAGIPVKIVLRNYNRFLSHLLDEYGIDNSDVINMYDFFQGTVNILRKEQHLRLLDSIPLSDYHIEGIDNNSSRILESGKQLATIHVMPETVQLIGDIEYLDDRGNKALKEIWDWRGFKSMVETYHPDGKVATQRYLRLDGTTALEVTHMYINNEVLPTMWKLFDYYGRNYVFDNENQLFTFFLNELNIQERGTWVSDRRSLDECVLNIDNPVQTIASIHTLTFINYKKPRVGILPAYQLALNQLNKKFDTVVFPTKSQMNDVTKTVNDGRNFVYAIDSGMDKVDKPRRLRRMKKDLVLVYRGMFVDSKRITDLIKAFHQIHKQDATVKLRLQGYFPEIKYHENIKKLIDQLELNDGSLELVDYSIDSHIYDDATLFINASENEAFGIGMLESMSHGVPVLSYDIPYTNHNLIKNGVNGVLVKNKTPSALAKEVVDLINNPNYYYKLSQGAAKTAAEFNYERIAKRA